VSTTCLCQKDILVNDARRINGVYCESVKETRDIHYMEKIQRFGMWCIYLPPCCVALIILACLVTQNLISVIQLRFIIREVIKRSERLELSFCVVLLRE
jgi:hypothetical protein